MQVATYDLNVTLVDKSTTSSFKTVAKGNVYKSEVYISANNAPEMIIAVPIMTFNHFAGMASARINLLDIWNLVDNIKIGKNGVAFVLCKTGLLFAHGDEDSKIRIIKQENLNNLRIVRETLAGRSLKDTYDNYRGVNMLAVSAPIKSLGWGVFIEQPTSEAYAPAYRLSYQFAVMIAVFLTLVAFIGYLGGRRYILSPISKIIEVTGKISDGNLWAKVDIKTKDEFSALGDSINFMTDRLVELQDDVRKKERDALIGKIAAGLIHDLKHPIGNIEMSSRLIQTMYHEESYRKTFKTVVEREFKNINRFLDALRNYACPMQMVITPIDINELIRGIIVSMGGKLTGAGILLTTDIYAGKLSVPGDKFALNRVFTNIIVNAIQAIEDKDKNNRNREKTEKEIKFSTYPDPLECKVIVTVEDSGIGIPVEKINGIFDDYTTTKKKGLGLGLAICKKTIDQHKGEITVESILGKGTKFSVILPAEEKGMSKGEVLR